MNPQHTSKQQFDLNFWKYADWEESGEVILNWVLDSGGAVSEG